MIEVPKYFHPTLRRWVPVAVPIAPNGTVYVNLKLADEICLLPEWWNGRYPRTSNRARITRLSEEQGHRCCYCGKKTWTKHYGEKGSYKDMATVEHIRCKMDGGTLRHSNTAMACSQCNNERGLSNAILFMYEKLGLLDFELVPKEDEKE